MTFFIQCVDDFFNDISFCFKVPSPTWSTPSTSRTTSPTWWPTAPASAPTKTIATQNENFKILISFKILKYWYIVNMVHVGQVMWFYKNRGHFQISKLNRNSYNFMEKTTRTSNYEISKFDYLAIKVSFHI
jgi:hypothetical protein